MAHILLLPDSSPLEVESVEVNDQLKLITVTASTTPAEAACPLCKEPSQRVHSRYSRTLADLPCCGQRVQWNVQVRRFRCLNASCTRKLFTERLPTWAPAYARRTLRQKEALGEVACELGGKVGQRIAVRVGMSISHDTPVRLVRQSGPAATSTARVVGVDDFAWKKGRRYGTILIDLERHQVIDLLPDREAERLAAWLKAHPEVEIISRDRAGAYAEGARTGAPSALQIADRFHLLLNLTEAVTRLCERKHEDLKHIHEQDVALDAAVPALAVQQETTAKPLTLARQQQQARHARRQNRYDEVKRLREQGVSQRAIATMLGLHRDPVHRYLTSTELPAMVRQPRRSKLDAYKDYLHQRSL